MTTIVNLTPHAITLVTEAGEVTFPPSGKIARVTVSEYPSSMDLVLDGKDVSVEVVSNRYGVIENLPEAERDVLYLVSGMVFDRTTRMDVVAPDTGPTANRNEAGHIVSVNRLRFNLFS